MVLVEEVLFYLLISAVIFPKILRDCTVTEKMCDVFTKAIAAGAK